MGWFFRAEGEWQNCVAGECGLALRGGGEFAGGASVAACEFGIRAQNPLRKFTFRLAAHWRVGLLALVTTLVWLAHYDRWTVASWQVPIGYDGDSLEILTRLQAAAEGDTVPLRPQIISRLGAPFGANWSAYPSSDLLLIWLLGQAARVVGVYPAANLAVLLAVVSSALAFYGCARWLRVRWEWAFAAALLFAYTYQSFHRGLAHLFLMFSWTVPLALVACGIVAASRRVRWRGRMGWFCIGTGAAIGSGNPYTLFMFLQLLGWAIVAQWLGPRRRENLIAGGLAMAAALGAFLVVESHIWLFAPEKSAPSPIVRAYGGTEVYALKPMELVLPPPGHRWGALAFFGHRYERWTPWRGGEAFAPYLGIVGAAALAWLGLAALRAVMRRKRLPGVVLPTAWVLMFASLGGVTNILAFYTGLNVFRATNRFSIFVSAAVLLFVAGRMSRWSVRPPAWLARWASPRAWRMTSATAATALAAFGVLEQLPRAPGMARQEQIARQIESDRELGRRLEDALPQGAMVFQLPVLEFPEIVPPHRLTDYDYFRPYLATQSLRFSYGPLKGRSGSHWQRDAERMPVARLVRRLERAGFAALYFNRKGFPDGGEKLLRDLEQIGRTRRIEAPAGEQVVVLLEPAKRVEPPLAETLTFGRGWHDAKPGEPRWAYEPATLAYFNPHRRAVRAELRLVVSGIGARTLVLRVNRGEEIARAIGEEKAELNLAVTLRPGFNRIAVQTLEPAVRVDGGMGQLRTFAVHATGVTLEGDGGS